MSLNFTPVPPPQYLQDAVNSDTELKFTVPSLALSLASCTQAREVLFCLEDVSVQAPHRLHFSCSGGFVCLLLFLSFSPAVLDYLLWDLTSPMNQIMHWYFYMCM